MQRDPTRDEQAKAAARSEEVAHGRGRIEEVLEVVEEQQELPSAEKPGEVVRRSDDLCDLRGQKLAVGEAGERHPEDAVALRAHELGRDLEREPGLSRAARAGEREQARAVREPRDELFQLALPAHERARRDRQVRRVERAERREVARAELVEALGAGEVLQAVLAEVADRRVGIEQSPGRLGDDDLASVRGSGDARGTVHVEADVALVRHDRLARVDPDPHADGAALERLAPVGRGGDRVRRPREGDEEGVSLRVHLHPAVLGEGGPQRTPVVGEQLDVRGAVLLEQPRRALDVGEEERHRAARQVPSAHGAIIAPADR